MKHARSFVPQNARSLSHGAASAAHVTVRRIASGALVWVAGFGCSVAALAGPPLAKDAIVLIDASRTGKPAIVYATAEIALKKSSSIGFMRLSPPLSTALECCARVTQPTSASRDLQARLAGAAPSARFTTAQLTQRQPAPFIGVGFVGATAETIKIMRENEHSFLLNRAGTDAEERVQHCVSGETFHLRVIDRVTAQEKRRYSLPLGMDVEADCTEQIMPTLTK